MDRVSTLVNQFRRPTGWFGQLNLSAMNRRHSKLTDWGLKHTSIEKNFAILDVGCGGGRTVYKLATLASEGKIYGIDHSEESVAASRRTSARWIETGRVEIRHAPVSELPFSNAAFDLVTAVETHFYWPDLLSDMREVLRVLKPGGTFLIIAEAYRGGKYDKRLQRFADVMGRTGHYSHLSVDEHRDLFSKTGYSDGQVFEEYDKGWICAMGRKPSSPCASPFLESLSQIENERRAALRRGRT
ncbi:MAG TPA: class I SAM-dependent methyltransferase [Thermoanaerobaculia bacterium]|nr:class I SAM-dependent methyltransferase [Thermoanaerobaculia bacterium]